MTGASEGSRPRHLTHSRPYVRIAQSWLARVFAGLLARRNAEMLKQLLVASVLAVALVVSVGVEQLHAECYMDCTIIVTPNYTITSCTSVGCG